MCDDVKTVKLEVCGEDPLPSLKSSTFGTDFFSTDAVEFLTLARGNMLLLPQAYYPESRSVSSRWSGDPAPPATRFASLPIAVQPCGKQYFAAAR